MTDDAHRSVTAVGVRIGGHDVIQVAWEFAVMGGSFGAADATTFGNAVADAIERRLPLVTRLRSGGTRLTEGMHALVGIPRALLALDELRAAGLPHIAVMDGPTTGGVWVAVGSTADIRIGVRGAVVGFSGPRIAEAMTGRPMTGGAGTAQGAYDAGLLDVLVEPNEVEAAVARPLTALGPEDPETPQWRPAPPPSAVDGWEHVGHARTADRPGGEQLLATISSAAVPLRGRDPAVTACLGRVLGRRMAGVALSANRSAMPGPGGFALLARVATLAGALGVPLVVLVDTPGADPHTELAALAPAMATAMSAVLRCDAPTISLVHGAGGSGGALAGAVTDVVGVGPHGWFAALGPEGAAATLHRQPAEATRLMRVTPADLLASGFTDDYVASGQEATWLATSIDRLRATEADVRLTRRHERWGSPLRG